MFIFFILLVSAIILYANNYKILALTILFAFLTSGFNLIPEEVVDLGTGLSKSQDYAFFILVGILIIDTISVKNYFKPDTFTRFLLIFYAFLFCCILYSKFVVGLSWSDIIRTSRYHFFWMLYFVFRNIEADDLIRLLKYLFIFTIIVSGIYLFQHMTGDNILNYRPVTSIKVLGFNVKRFYNQPDTLQFFAVLALFANPFRGTARIATSAILLAALFGAFHRSLTGFFIFALLIGFLVQLSKEKKIKVLVISACLLIPTMIFAGNRLSKSGTFADIRAVFSGDFANIEFDIEDLENATFSFRIGHLYERIKFLSENPQAQIFGAGLMPEDSKLVDRTFDFIVGLIEENTERTVQLETGDISYSILFIRLGYVGTFLNILLYFYLIHFFYKNRKNKYALLSLVFLILTLGISFFSANLLYPITFALPLITYSIVKKQESSISEIKTTSSQIENF